MRVRAKRFLDFAYGDKRKDKAMVKAIVEEIRQPFDPAKDYYKKFRDTLIAFEEGRISKADFLNLHTQVTANKASSYEVLSRKYLEAKEDNALVWQGQSAVVADISGLEIKSSWYLRTESRNQRMIVALHFNKERLPQKHEQGLLTILQLAEPASAGVGILCIQPATMVSATRQDDRERKYLQERAAKFVSILKTLPSD